MSSREHVPEVDVVRVLTFAAVIAVHTISHVNAATSQSAGGVLMLAHFTREAFFFLTGFVLIHAYRHRPVNLASFYRRRLRGVVLPYLVFSAVYTYLPVYQNHTWHASTATAFDLLRNVATGTACYHLYFLLVSLQIYLLYPLIERLLRATAGHHGWLLALSGCLQLGFTAWLQYGAVPGALRAHQDALVLSYQFFVLAGAVAAFHLEQFRQWITENLREVRLLVIVAAALTLDWYVVDVLSGSDVSTADAVLQPVMALWSMAAILGLFALGTRWRTRGVPDSWMDRALHWGSDRSFGIFLVHPAILGLVLDLQVVRAIPVLAQTALAYLATVAGSVLVVELLRRAPGSRATTGRARLHSRHSERTQQHQEKQGHSGVRALAKTNDGRNLTCITQP